MSHEKQITLYSNDLGPNGWKVTSLLEELGLTYETIFLDFNKGEHKALEYTRINPNGRIPAIIDHKNYDFVVWESGAIMLYLTEKYDKERKYTYASDSEVEKYALLQWVFFQVSGQGPYFGQASWFVNFHHEQLPSAKERYANEVKRVLGVLEGYLSKAQNGWLVAGKVTIADIMFAPWDDCLPYILADFDFKKEFPATYDWHQRVYAIPGVKKALDDWHAVIEKLYGKRS
ncbi:Glutathione S-transferase 2 [Steccherinum ochraceum]|uniref:glutathione transferase n=1 Tax=Steccherinum ochraceum TaxID=92696 RepID=A0A4R0R5E1_9APHY|nr:Glutathione S-transferase 2 [Steccherinum ochraceum]